MLLLAAAIAIPLGLDLYLPAPEDNPLTPEKIELGRRLFSDRRLSRDNSTACVTCHEPERAFSDGRPVATGVFGRKGRRNSPALINRGYGRAFFWDGRIATLEEQVLKPIEDPNEMDMPIAEAVRHALSGERKYWPSDRRLREVIRSQPFYYQGRQDQKMLIFRRLEESYEHKETIDWDKAALSIEHVMPQTLSEEWRQELAIDGEDPEAVHAELLHTLGNLTITAYNSELSNDPHRTHSGGLLFLLHGDRVFSTAWYTTAHPARAWPS